MTHAVTFCLLLLFSWKSALAQETAVIRTGIDLSDEPIQFLHSESYLYEVSDEAATEVPTHFWEDVSAEGYTYGLVAHENIFDEVHELYGS